MGTLNGEMLKIFTLVQLERIKTLANKIIYSDSFSLAGKGYKCIDVQIVECSYFRVIIPDLSDIGCHIIKTRLKQELNFECEVSGKEVFWMPFFEEVYDVQNQDD